MNETQLVAALEVALTRWSIGVQAGIVTVLVVVFGFAWFTTRRRVALSWAVAWCLDAVALSAVFFIAWKWGVLSNTGIHLLYVVYGVSKSLFALFLLVGLLQYRRFTLMLGRPFRYWTIVGTLVWGAFLLVVCQDPVDVQLAVYVLVGCSFLTVSLHTLWFARRKGSRMVGTVLLIHGTLFIHHAVSLLPSLWGGEIPAFMSHVSFVDAVSEFLVGLGCVMAVGWRIIDEIAVAHRNLENAHRALRDLVDIDPLTGLANRRKLRDYVDGLKEQQGTLVYLDLDQFKMINDGWGHAAGDDCLCRVAHALRKAFRPEDGLFRIGGDEFLVIIPRLPEIDARTRIQRLRDMLAMPDERGIPMHVSVGIASFGEQVSLEDALEKADSAMYRDKGLRIDKRRDVSVDR